ncbi:hypothetical protein PUN28_000727 [Cardiocondyla obscurior]
MKSSSVMIPTFLSAALGYGICRLTPFRANAKYAAAISGIVGMVSSRIAISEMCLLKVASMPNSNLRERLIEAGYHGYRSRERQYPGFRPIDVQTEIQSSSEPSTGITFNDYPPMNSYDTYSSINGSSDSYSEDTGLTESINLQKGVTYDELRQKNRDEFYKKNKQWHTPRTREPLISKETPEQDPTTYNPSPVQKRNKYGDLWE